MMRSARILACGLVLAGALTSAALATTEPAPPPSEQSGSSDSVVVPTSPASGTQPAPPADAQAATEPAAKPDVEPDAAAGSEPPGDAPPASASTAPDGAPAATASEATPEQPAAAAEAPAERSELQSELLRQIAEAKSIPSEVREALTEFYEGRGEDLLWVTGAAFSRRAEAAIAEIGRADDWGLEAAAFDLPSAPGSSEPAEVAGIELKLSLAVLEYARHARGGRMDPKQLSNYIDREPPLLAPAAVLAGVAAAEAVDGYLRGLHPQHPQFEKLRQAYLDLKRGTPPPEAAEEKSPPAEAAAKKKAKQPDAGQVTLRKLLHNMEQWRWMPENLGPLYVWANIPEFTLRVMEDGEAIHTERLIGGKRDTQTPIFSDEMETIVLHPVWGVPDSIKVKELLPSLARGGNVLARNNLRIQYRGRDIDPASVDWRTTDIRNFHVYQPPGGGNVLGVVKFLFPNKHQVYMHDTPTKNLFAASQRMFSHGCMRIRDPMRLAEILLARDKGWEPGRAAALVKNGPRNNHITLDTKVPVHITYFTAWVGEDGKVHTRPDVYGHEQRIQMGLEGKAHLIARKKEDLGPVRAEVLGRLAETGPSWSSSSKQPDWVRRAFGN